MFVDDKNKYVGEPPLRGLEVKADPFSLESLIPWLETKDPDETYCYLDTGHCLLAQYLKQYHGTDKITVGGHSYSYADERHDLPDWKAEVVQGWPRTFGGALYRARDLLQAQAKPERLS